MNTTLYNINCVLLSTINSRRNKDRTTTKLCHGHGTLFMISMILMLLLPSNNNNTSNAFQINLNLSKNINNNVCRRTFSSRSSNTITSCIPYHSRSKSKHQAATTSNTTHTSYHQKQQCDDDDDDDDDDCFKDIQQEEQTMILPIFPLRKRVKFPTESVQLTLWEERYKSLAQNVLNQQKNTPTGTSMCSCTNSSSGRRCNHFHTFGIVYASHKPQFIRDGNGPITPLIECGDTGVICVVKEYTLFENDVEKVNAKNFPLIPDMNDKQHKDPIVKDINDWNKIKLIGLGIERFEIEDIIHNGYQEDHEAFLMVKARKISDVHVGNCQNDKINNDKLDEFLQQKRQIEDKLNADLNSLFKDLEHFQTVEKKYFGSGEDDFDKDETNATIKFKAIEDWSFAIISTLEADFPAVEMLNMLSTTSLEERLKYIAQRIS